jgi:hypothetical protein
MADFSHARQWLANLWVRGRGSQTPEVYRSLIDSARTESERAEQVLADQSVEFRRMRERSRVGLKEVAAALPRASALVSLARFEDVVMGVDSSGRSTSVTRYAAFVLRGGEEVPAVVRLGSANRIDSLVVLWRNEVARVPDGGTTSAYRRIGETLALAVWEPVAAHLAGAERVFIVPDGSLQLVNLAALPVEHDRYLVETGPLIHYLSAERDLVRPEKEPSNRGEGLLALGGIDYHRSAPPPVMKSKPTNGVAATGIVTTAVYRGATSDLRLRELRDHAVHGASSLGRGDRRPHETVEAISRDGYDGGSGPGAHGSRGE